MHFGQLPSIYELGFPLNKERPHIGQLAMKILFSIFLLLIINWSLYLCWRNLYSPSKYNRKLFAHIVYRKIGSLSIDNQRFILKEALYDFLWKLKVVRCLSISCKMSLWKKQGYPSIPYAHMNKQKFYLIAIIYQKQRMFLFKFLICWRRSWSEHKH